MRAWSGVSGHVCVVISPGECIGRTIKSVVDITDSYRNRRSFFPFFCVGEDHMVKCIDLCHLKRPNFLEAFILTK